MYSCRSVEEMMEKVTHPNWTMGENVKMVAQVEPWHLVLEISGITAFLRQGCLLH